MVVDFPQIALDKAIVNVMSSGTVVRGVFRSIQIETLLNLCCGHYRRYPESWNAGTRGQVLIA